MAISFGDNLDKSFAYTNGAFKKFSGWFILIILSAIIYGATFAMVFALIAFFIGIFMALPASGVTDKKRNQRKNHCKGCAVDNCGQDD